MKNTTFEFTPLEQKVIALSMVGILERNGIKGHGVDTLKLIVDLEAELQQQAEEEIQPSEINDHVAKEMLTILPLFTEKYQK